VYAYSFNGIKAKKQVSASSFPAPHHLVRFKAFSDGIVECMARGAGLVILTAPPFSKVAPTNYHN